MKPLTKKHQAIVAAPGFCLGVCCDETQILGVEFLESCAEQAPENALATEAARQLRGYLADADYRFSLPLKPAGTEFQRRVWEGISNIPAHKTLTYADLAKSLKNAPRAVGQACGANPYPVIVPCHRVVAANGGLGGFARQRDGFLLEVKRWLLAHEKIG